MEVYGTATGVGSGTVDLAELALYSGGQATDFDGYGVSSLTDSSDAFVTTYTSGSNRLTFIPASTYTASAVVEVWQPTFNATIINNYIDAAIDNVRDEVLQEWGSAALAVGYNDENEFFIPRTPKYIYGVRMGAAPVVGYSRSNLDSYEPFKNVTGRTRVAQGFKVSSDTLVRGICFYMKMYGTITSQTVQGVIQTDSGGFPSGLAVDTTVNVGTVPSAHFGVQPQWYHFDSGQPILLTAGTQYHAVLASTGSADSSNYLQCGMSAASGYSDGALAQMNSSNVWSAETLGLDMMFQVIPWFDTWTDLYDHEWELYKDTSNTYLRLLHTDGINLPVSDLGYYPTYSEGTPIQLLGLERADRPTSDTAEMEISRAYLESQVMAYVMRDLGMREESAFWTRQAERELTIHPVRTILPSGSRRVFISG